MSVKADQTNTYLNVDDDTCDITEMEMKRLNANVEDSSQSSLPHLTRRILRGPLAPINNCINAAEKGFRNFFHKHEKVLTISAYILLFAGYLVYVITACILNFKRAKILVYLTAIFVACFLYWIVKKYFGDKIWKEIMEPIRTKFVVRYWKFLKWAFIILFTAFAVFWIIYDTWDDPERLISLAGLFTYILIGFLTSKNRDQIKWRPVLWGFALQFLFGLLILRTKFGYEVFKWIGDRVSIFLGFSKAGSDFLFKDLYQFAFTVLPIIVYFSAVTYVIYYLGLIQVIITKVAWLLHVTLGTSPTESFNAAGNIFIGQTEAPLLIRPFLSKMTDSELHAVMTGGFATIAGSVLGAYIYLGVSAHHLLSASVMSAPAALAMSKLMCPEVDEPEVKDTDDIQVEKTEETNVFEAVAVGASMSISLIANIAVMLIAFLSILKCANSLLGWLGSMVGEPRFSFEFICSYVFMPFAYIMGVSWKDSFKVAELLGVKTFINEFIAYERFVVFVKNKERGVGDTLSTRSEVITTYALCGFANFGSIGVQLGGLTALAPNKRAVLSKLVFRAMCAGTMACFMTACIAGILYEEGKYEKTIQNSTLSFLNTTMTP